LIGKLSNILLKAIGVAMLQWPLVSFWDLFAAGTTENQQTSCRGIASGAAKMILWDQIFQLSCLLIFFCGKGHNHL